MMVDSIERQIQSKHELSQIVQEILDEAPNLSDHYITRSTNVSSTDDLRRLQSQHSDPSVIRLDRVQQILEQEDPFHVVGMSGVLMPCYSRSGTFAIERLKKEMSGGEKILDLGTGSGLIATAAALMGASKVKAIDINPDAVFCATQTAALNDVSDIVSAIESDGFSSIQEETYDYIVFNAPFWNKAANPSDGLDLALFDKNHELLERVLMEAPSHLKTGGKMILALSDQGDLNRIHEIIENSKFEIERLETYQNGHQRLLYTLRVA